MARRRFCPEHTRTIALVGHRSSGKTTLGEMLCVATGVVRQAGRVDDGSTLLDHDSEERSRRLSLHPSFAWMTWNDCLVELVDTPGAAPVRHHTRLALSGVDAAIVVVGAPDGVEHGTRQLLRHAAELGLPRVVALTKCDRPHQLDVVLEELEDTLGAKPILLQLPLFDSLERFTGVVDLLTHRALRYDLEESSGSLSPEPITDSEAAQLAWDAVTEAAAMTDDALLEEYLEYLELPRERVMEALAHGVRSGDIVPVVLCSGLHNVGAHPLLDVITQLLPSPEARTPAVARAFDGAPVPLKPDGDMVVQLLASHLDDGERYHVLRVWQGEARTGTWVAGSTGSRVKVRKLYELRGPRRAALLNPHAGALVATWDDLEAQPGEVFTLSERLTLALPRIPPPMVPRLLVPREERDAARLPDAVRTLVSTDPGLRIYTDETTGGLLIAGISEAHVEHAVGMLRRRLHLSVSTQLPPVAYREMPAASVRGVRGEHRQTDSYGLVSEFGACELDIDPCPEQTDVHFIDQTDDEHVPSKYRNAVSEGIRAALRSGPKAGYPVVGAQVKLVGGAYNILSSTEDHFSIAGETAARQALEAAGTVLLEPWSRVEVQAPDSHLGDVVAELSSRRGRILGVEGGEEHGVVEALVPYRDLRTFGPRLEAITHGLGCFELEHHHYEVLPANLEREALKEREMARTG